MRTAALGALGALVLLLVVSGPAWGLSQQGHEFAGAFGSEQLAGPSDVAVNEATGDVYVLDSAANRVVVFGPAPEHALLATWGWGVGGGSEYEVCSSACKPGLAGTGEYEFDSPVAIVVDNSKSSESKGDVYVVANRGWKKAAVDKFTASGERVAVLLRGKAEREFFMEGTAVVGIATDGKGDLWVEREDESEAFYLERFDDLAGANGALGEPIEVDLEELDVKRPVRPGFALGPEGDMYVTYEPRGLDPEEEKEAEKETKHSGAHKPCVQNPCLVAKLGFTPLSAEAFELPVFSYGLDAENSTGVAADQSSGDVYVDNQTSVAAVDVSGSLIQRFGSEQLQDKGGSGVAVDSATGEVLVADMTAHVIDSYTPAKTGPPMIERDSVGAEEVTSSSAAVRATIDPDGEETSYRFRYCTEGEAHCSETPASELPAAFGDQHVSVKLEGLSPETTYSLSVHAESSLGQATSESRLFTTGKALLPDSREWELVTPALKHGASVAPTTSEGGLVEAAAGGGALAYLSSAPIGENQPQGNRGPEPSQILARRTSEGWTAQDLATPNGTALGGLPGKYREYLFFSSELEAEVVHPHSVVPLSSQDSESTVYLRNNLSCSSEEGCFQPLVEPGDDSGPAGGPGAVQFEGATADLSHVVLRSTLPLLEGVKGNQLYEWSNGNLTLVSVPPEGQSQAGTVALGNAQSEKLIDTAISADGSRIVWRTEPQEGHLYLREVPQQQTLQIDEPNEGASGEGKPDPTFQGASADGTRIFFTDPERLTAQTPEAAPEVSEPENLYVFEPEKPAGERLTDLSAPLAAGAGIDVLGAVLGISENGSKVYFVADGPPAEGGAPGDCEFFAPPGAECNLYVAHMNNGRWEGAPERITSLSSEDSPDWSRANGSQFNLRYKTSEVSANGEYLAFMSDRSLTGYDNDDRHSGVPDEEVFIFHYGSGEIVCASCNPSGEPPIGVHDIEESGEGIGLLVDRAETWLQGESGGVDHWLAGSVPGWTEESIDESFYQSRYLRNDGRLFFDSSDSLVTGDENNGKEDVYEYEPLGVGGCRSANTVDGCVALISSGKSSQESAFLDASESGDDVFFLESAQNLVPQEVEAGYDIYDARVCGIAGAEACPKAPPPPVAPCAGEDECKAPPPGLPVLPTPGTASVRGVGNVSHIEVLGSQETQKPKPPSTTKPVSSRGKKLAAALKACKRDKKKNTRKSCEKQARKRYGAKKAKKANSHERGKR